jgi:hypothetical protein
MFFKKFKKFTSSHITECYYLDTTLKRHMCNLIKIGQKLLLIIILCILL